MENLEYTDLFQYLNYEKSSEKRNPKDYSNYVRQFTLKENKIFKGNHQIIFRYDMEKYFTIFHDHPTRVHFSAEIIYDKIKSHYIWMTMRKDIEEYCRSCDDY